MGLFHVPRLRIRRGREKAGKGHRKSRRIVIIIIGQPLCPVVGRRPQHAVSKLACLVHSSARSCRSGICPGRLSTAWLVSLVVFSCHNMCLWSPSGNTRGPSVVFEADDMPCPRPFHFSHIADYIYDIVFSLTQMLVFLSLYVMLSILLSILVCAAASLFCACLVSVHVSAPYVIAGSTQELYTCLFRQMARLLLKISWCLAYAAQPAMIIRCISLSWFFSLTL